MSERASVSAQESMSLGRPVVESASVEERLRPLLEVAQGPLVLGFRWNLEGRYCSLELKYFRYMRQKRRGRRPLQPSTSMLKLVAGRLALRLRWSAGKLV